MEALSVAATVINLLPVDVPVMSQELLTNGLLLLIS